jgi:TolB-like protein/Tfp pilus assembly protein PilF
MHDLLAELRRRNVFRVAVAYVVVGWILVEAADVLLGNFAAPDWVFRAFAVLVLLGFPLALLFAWAFELTPEGLRRTDEVSVADSITSTTGRRLDFIIIALLGIALAYFMTTHDWAGDDERAQGANRSLTSIAVLPFVNMSGDADNEYFSDGISEELISLLTSSTDLHVAGRSSSFAFKGRSEDLRVIGEELGVDSILEGSVRRSGDRVRITAQLTSSADGYQLWSQSYDRTLDDLFAVQDDIARNILTALRGALGDPPAGMPVKTVAPTLDAEAYQFYLQGRYHFHKRGGEHLRKSISFFEQAIARDPGFAAAYAGLAAAVFVLPGYSLETYDSLIGVARQNAARALALDDGMSEARVVLGAVSGMELDWIAARGHFERAVADSPRNPVVRHWYGVHLVSTAQLEDATEQLMRAHELEPLSPVIAAWLGATEQIRGAYGPAARYRKLAVAGGYPNSYYRLFQIAHMTGELQQADSALAAYIEATGIGTPADAALIAAAVNDPARREDAIEALARLQPRFPIPWHAVDLYVLLDAMEQAFDAAEAAVETHDMIAVIGIWMPIMKPFRKHPRFPALVDQMKLVDYWNEFGWPAMCRPVGGTVSCD